MPKFTTLLLSSFLILITILPTQTTQAQVIYVDQNATGIPDGLSWSTAYTDLQDAFDAAFNGDEIWVSQGTYVPTRTFEGNTDPAKLRERTFYVSNFNQLFIYGGFNGTENALSERDPAANLVYLDGDIGVAGDDSDNAYHVLSINQANGVKLDGFVIRGGRAQGPGFHENGAGIYASTVDSLTLANVMFNDNKADNYGGGMYNVGNSDVMLQDATFCGNEAYSGAGMYNYNDAGLVIRNSQFCGNIAADEGGGMYTKACQNVYVVNTVFYQNISEYHGAGMYNHCIQNLNLTNLTIVGNVSDESGGGHYTIQSNGVNVYNSILYLNIDHDDLPTSDAQMWQNANQNMSVVHSLIQGSQGSGANWVSTFTDGGGNYDLNPVFFDVDGLDNLPCTDDDNLRLTLVSPGINAGDNTAPGLYGFDLDGEVRIQDGIVDIGAYENSANGVLPVEWESFEGYWELGQSSPKVNLEWATSREINAHHYVIERSEETPDRGVLWTAIGTVDAKGNSQVSNRYAFTDRQLPNLRLGSTLFYRLRQVDIDGSYSFSTTVKLNYSPEQIFLMEVYPNPSRGPITITATLSEESPAEELSLLNPMGQTVFRRVLDTQYQVQEQLNVRNLTPGYYIVQIRHRDGVIQQRLLVK